jgi:Cdc6-like AAA superfamily ATPase
MQYEEIEQLIVPGTAKSFTNDANYYSRLKNDDKPVLLIQGEPGIGKSSLAFSLMQELRNRQEVHPKTSVAYVFFKEQFDALSSVRWALGAIASQIAEGNPDYCNKVPNQLKNYGEQKFNVMDTEDIWQKFFLEPYQARNSKRGLTALNNNPSSTTQQLSPDFGNEVDGNETTGSVAHDLTRNKYQENADINEPLLLSFFDGIDELPQDSRDLLMTLTNMLKPASYRVKIVITARTDTNSGSSQMEVPPMVLPLSHDQIVDDIRRLAQARCGYLPRP